MILSLHSTTGAILASNSNSLEQAIILGIVSHYFLDSIPHVEYKIKNIQKGDLKMAAKEFTKIFFDLLIGFIVILYLIQNKSFDQSILILVGSFFALLSDGLYFTDCLIKNKDQNIFTKSLKTLTNFHQKIHSSITNKLITIPSQIITVLILIYIIFK
ncbi:MAG: hypothetical protein AAB621_01045 [Patescibacteria group bacterium]